MSKIILTTHSELEQLIQEIIRKVLNEAIEEPPAGSKEIFTVDEASKFLNLAKQTLYGFTSKNLIPFIKRGKKLYFKKADLTLWLMEGRKLTKDEIEAGGFESLKIKKGGVQ
ncbi:MAG: helix-turn-helix domain-containing protein [Pseudomonadota bacterium]